MAAEKNTPTSGQPGLTPKQLAEQARAESEAAERRRERTIRIVGGLVVLLVVGGLLAVGVPRRAATTAPTAPRPPAPTPDPSAASPAGVGAELRRALRHRLDVGGRGEAAHAGDLGGLPVPGLQAGRGGIRRPDPGRWPTPARSSCSTGRPPSSTSAWPRTTRPTAIPNSSARATSAWGCAIDAGKAGEYHSAVFDIQPAEEGVGYSDQQLIDLGTTVGIAEADLATYTKCVQDGTYLGWAANSNQAVRRQPVWAEPPRPTSTAWSSTAPTSLTSRASRRRSTPRPPSDRRAGHLDPQPGPVGLAPGPAAAAGVRAVHPGRASSSPCGSATGAGSPAVATRAWSTTSPSGPSRSGSSAGGSTTS